MSIVHTSSAAAQRCRALVACAGGIALLAACSHQKLPAADGAPADAAPADQRRDVLPPADQLACIPGLEGSWAVAASGTRSVYPMGFAVDGAGNAAFTGKLAGEIAFGEAVVQANVDGEYGFLAATDSTGRFAWAQGVGERAGEYYLPGVAFDPAGRRIVTGQVNGAARIGGRALEGDHGFVAAFAADGSLAWLDAFEGGAGTDVAADAAGNVFVAGAMHGTVTVEGEARTGIVLGSRTVSCPGKGLGDFVAKLDGQGAVLWATPICTTALVHLRGIAVDGAGNSHLTGGLTGSGQLTAGGHSVTVSGDPDSFAAFVVRLDPLGAPAWIVPVIAERGAGMNDVGVDGAGNVYVAASISGKATIGAKVLEPEGAIETLVAKLDAGGQLVWATQISGLEADANSLAVTAGGESAVLFFAPDPVTVHGVTYDDPRRSPLLVITLDAAGKPIAGIRGGSSGAPYPNRLRFDAEGNAYVAGMFKGAAWFGCDRLGASNGGLFLWKVGKLF